MRAFGWNAAWVLLGWAGSRSWALSGETDPYFEHFGIVAPVMPPAVIGDDVISGTTPMVNVFTEEEVQADYAVRCR